MCIRDRLGLAGYVQDGVMSQEGIHRLCGVLIECRMLLSQFEMERSFVFATASLRNIQNLSLIHILSSAATRRFFAEKKKKNQKKKRVRVSLVR